MRTTGKRATVPIVPVDCDWASRADREGGKRRASAPSHRRFTAPWRWTDQLNMDPGSQARCVNFGEPKCDDWRCPRHTPTGYADSMARHAEEVPR